MKDELKSPDIHYAFIQSSNIMKGTRICHLKYAYLVYRLFWTKRLWKPTEAGKALKPGTSFPFVKKIYTFLKRFPFVKMSSSPWLEYGEINNLSMKNIMA